MVTLKANALDLLQSHANVISTKQMGVEYSLIGVDLDGQCQESQIARPHLLFIKPSIELAVMPLMGFLRDHQNLSVGSLENITGDPNN
jgi:hypothetical protein